MTKQEHKGWTALWVQERRQIFLRIVADCCPMMVAAGFPPQQLIVLFLYTLWSATVFCFVANKAADPKPNQDDGNIFFNCFELYP